MKKRGSLSLSVNAIVILVLALTMLGLGIAFMRGMFNQLDATVKQVTPDQLTNPPNRDNPLTISPGELNVRSTDKPQRIIVAFMNTLEAPYQFQLELESSSGGAPGNWIQGILTPVTLGKEGINVWTVVVDPSDPSAPTGLQLIRVKIKQASGDYEQTKDISIKISA